MKLLTKVGTRILFFAIAVLSVNHWNSLRADELNYVFTGVLPSGASSHPSVADGETWVAVFTINPSAVDSEPADVTTGRYIDGAVSGVISFSGGHVYQTNTATRVEIFDNAEPLPGYFYDSIIVSSTASPHTDIRIQAFNETDLSSVVTDALPPVGSEFSSAPTNPEVGWFQLSFHDDGGSVLYNSFDATNVDFIAKSGVVFDNTAVGTTSPYFDVTDFWLPGLLSGAPTSDDTAVFGLAGSYDVWWDGFTGDRSNLALCVLNGDVTIDNRDGGNYTYTATELTTIAHESTLIFGDGVDSLDFVTNILRINGQLVGFADTTMTAGLVDVGLQEAGLLRLDGTGTVLDIGVSAMYVGAGSNGEIFIQNGAVVNDAGSPRIGGYSGSQGVVTVTGSSSIWNVNSNLHVGNFEGTNGILHVLDGGRINVAGNLEQANATSTISLNVIEVENSVLDVNNDVFMGGSSAAAMVVSDGGEVSAFDQFNIGVDGEVSTAGSGIPRLIANTFVNLGEMSFDGAIGTDVIGDVFNASEIHSKNSTYNIFFGNVVHEGTFIQTDASAITQIIGSASGTGGYTGSGFVDFRGPVKPGTGSGSFVPGSISIAGNLGLASGSTFEVDLGGTGLSQFDRLLVSGNVTLANGSLSVSSINGFPPDVGDQFVIVTIGGERTGIFNGLDQGALVANVGGTNLFIDYFGGDGNDIELTTVAPSIILGDVNLDGLVNLLDVNPFVDLITNGIYQVEADINLDQVVDLLDVGPFVEVLVGL